ncbi:MAG: nucleoside 2-deoxyribosyltransferase [Candidatus Bathyarchaeia archaeon]
MPLGRLKIYLSHPLGLRREIREWTRELEKSLHVRIWIPFHKEARDVALLERRKLKPYSKEERRKSEKIVEANLKAIRNCDVLIALLPYPSIGVIMEVFYSGYVLQKPTLVLTYMKSHPWLNTVASIYNTKEGIVNELKRIKDVMNYE